MIQAGSLFFTNDQAMSFTEPIFIFLFLPVVLAVNFILPRSWRNSFLLMASLLFYTGVGGKHVLVNYLAGLAINRAPEMKQKGFMLALGISANLALLGIFKYSNFLIANLNRVLVTLDMRPVWAPYVTLPIGISFFTFMGMSYLFDVYRQQIRAERRLDTFALYISLFPYLLAGPIVRYTEISRELIQRRINRAGFAEGIRRFIVGLGKKMLIANTLAVTVDRIFLVPTGQLSPGAAWFGAACYALQIYFDISGYSDMAIGLARMLGFHCPENFNYPYVAQSMTDFWRRWHITLVNWFRDYVFFPMSYRRPGWRIHLNLIIVFVLVGLWHAASRSFIIWGMMHGTLLVIERAGLTKLLNRLPRVVRHLYVILVVVAGGVFVRAETFAQSMLLLKAMMGFGAGVAGTSALSAYLNASLWLALAAGIIGSLPLIPRLRAWQERLAAGVHGARTVFVETGAGVLELTALAFVFLASVSLSAAETYRAFIYFRY
jgi:alginate O-acetyltransferase complex protein AlgI